MTFQVTFSDDTTSTRRFEEVGLYSTFEAATEAAKGKVEAYFGVPMVKNGKRLVIEIDRDKDYVGPCEDWFIAEMGKGSRAAIVAINCIPLTRIAADQAVS